MNTVIFDLDGTLLPMDVELFTNLYFNALGKRFNDIFPDNKIIEYVWYCTNIVIKSNNKATNKEVFMENFKKIAGDRFDECIERFDDFYANEFNVAKKATHIQVEMVKAVKLLKEKGYNIAVATNPLFPRHATIRRLQWAGFEEDDFSHITTYEENCYCKPNILYYQEVLDALNKQGNECIMVGNNVDEDLIASTLGLGTYLITNHVINKNNIEIKSDYIGDYKDFYDYVKALPVI